MSTLGSFGERLDLILDQEDESAIVSIAGPFVGEIQVRRTQGSPGGNSSELLFTVQGPDTFTLEGRQNLEYFFVMTDYTSGTATFSFVVNPLVNSANGNVVIGPQGPAGPTGLTGPQGIQGIQGPVGPPGSGAGSAASAITFAPTGGVPETNVQDAIEGLDTRSLFLESVINPNKVVTLGTFTSLLLPDPVAAGSGSISFSTTLNQPVYSDGVVWRRFDNNLPVTAVAVTFGPSGAAANVGQSETSLAAIDAAVQVALATFTSELEALHDARLALTDTDIQNANPGFVTLTGKTLTDLHNALNGGNRRLFLTNVGGDYNWSGSKQDFDDIELVGLVDAGMPCVVIGGTPKNRGQIQFPIRGLGGRVEGIEFKDGAICFSFVGATGTIPRMHMDFCKFTNVANSIHHEFQSAFGNPNAGAGCASIRWNNCIADNVSHGLNMRCGPGYGETGAPPAFNDFEVGAFEARESIVRNSDNMGICCHYDTRGGTSAAVFWPGIGAGSQGIISRCIVDSMSIGNLAGFPANLTSCQNSLYEDSFFTNELANPLGRDFDAYTKSDNHIMRGCVVWNTGSSSNFQGCIGLKGEGNPGALPLSSCLLENNLIGHDDSLPASRCIFVQRSNVTLRNNVMITADGSIGQGGGITQQGNGAFSNFLSTDNLYRCFGGFSQSAVAQLSANINNWVFDGDRFETFHPSAHTIIQVKDSSGFNNNGSQVNNCEFIKGAGAGPTAPIQVQVAGTVTNPVFNGNNFDIGTDTAIIISGAAVTGTITWTNNTSVGGPPGTFNGTSSVVNTFGPGGGNDFT